MTICGEESFHQGIVALKSALIFSANDTLRPYHFIVMTDPEMMANISDAMHSDLSSSSESANPFTYVLKQIEYPNMNDGEARVWRSLFKQCASQRLFLPALIDHDSVVYLDTDVLLFTSVGEIWSFFDRMNQTQLAAATFESEEYSTNWYRRFARHPYYLPYGLNSGVMLMNLTRMRQFGWMDRMRPILDEYGGRIVWGDQDIINIIFSRNVDRIFLMDCCWNYRPDHCVYSLSCRSAQQNGIRILHGNRGSFVQPDKQPTFRRRILLVLILVEWVLISCELIIDLYTSGGKMIDSRQANLVDLSHMKHALQVASLCIQTVFVIEVVIKLFVYGRRFFRMKHEMFDLMVVALSWTLSVVFIHHRYLHYTEAIIVLRIWNVLRVIYGKNVCNE
ncbi:glycosyltransferase-like protein [Euroglyphus maynei]|uniref:UDP-D-xylose:beta-D-glucoside alpha-1,3-D-xylosyltransferase n=1 Tax=Euroglyphus maynei TaxID=6958 RepID=A0A1Y3BG28_EURMA|nr:glycosyltransferase-like protein [Euroglyphus maynei]